MNNTDKLREAFKKDYPQSEFIVYSEDFNEYTVDWECPSIQSPERIAEAAYLNEQYRGYKKAWEGKESEIAELTKQLENQKAETNRVRMVSSEQLDKDHENIMSLSKQRDELESMREEYIKYRKVLAKCSGKITAAHFNEESDPDALLKEVKDVINAALSTQEANKDEDGPLCDHGVKYHECKYDCIQF